jgi:hypothetical protein
VSFDVVSPVTTATGAPCHMSCRADAALNAG